MSTRTPQLATPDVIIDVAQPGVSIVIPCFNEVEGLPHLERTFDRLIELFPGYEVELVLVDDGSTDGTWEALSGAFSDNEAIALLQHAHNKGIGAALMTGFQNASHAVVASIDSDGSYDVELLPHMVELLADDYDMVTASPYHPEGHVEHIAGWRLGLSKAASFFYRQLMTTDLYCYTSCCRVYRRRAVVDLPVRAPGFVGVAELIWRMDRRGARITEYPAVLSSRQHGASKMKVVRTAFAHVRFGSRILVERLTSRAPTGSPAAEKSAMKT